MSKQLKNKLLHVHNLSFRNTTQNNMTLPIVFKNILHFMNQDPMGKYKFIIGTDSQAHSGYTTFVTGIVIQREGRGVWACYRKVYIDRRLELREKIMMETVYTQEVASFFDTDKENEMISIIYPHLYHGATFEKEGHLDVGSGKKNKTRIFVEEMVMMIESVGLTAKIKPDSYVASAYANKYTK
jgi:predicted RNase H-related nuclease YkuK (DUF458 family)